MILATLRDGTPDGRLVVVSPSHENYAPAPVTTLQQVLETWRQCAPDLAGITEFPHALDTSELAAPLPRAWQWLDGSAYPAHGELMDQAIGVAKPKVEFPLMYQGASDKFYGPHDGVGFPSEDFGIDFEGEFGVIVDAVPMGVTPEEALGHIKLLVQINDWSLRTLAATEMKTGFGFVWAKPHCSMAPFAVTPDEIGNQWTDGRVCLDLLVDWNGKRFGAANGAPMQYGFHELVARAARTRDLVAGTVIGSGTVSNADFRQVGSSCIAERRGIEIVDSGAPRTDFMRFGDTIRMEAVTATGAHPFGAIQQRVIPA